MVLGIKIALKQIILSNICVFENCHPCALALPRSFVLPQGCQTPAEGLPLPLGSKDTQPALQTKPSQNAVIATSIEASIPQSIPATTSIDTSSVVLRDKSKRGRASANKEPYVIPRFDDLEEDCVTVGVFILCSLNLVPSSIPFDDSEPQTEHQEYPIYIRNHLFINMTQETFQSFFIVISKL